MKNSPPAGFGADRDFASSRKHSSTLSRLVRGRGLVGLVLLGLLILIGVCAPLLAPYPPNLQLDNANLLTPSAQHLLGTDYVNRDVFSRTLYGLRTDLVVVFVAVPIGAVCGTLLALAGTLSSAVDVALQRFFDVILAFPALIMAIGLTAVTGTGIGTVVAVIAIVETPIFGRMLRSSILKVRAMPYVEAAETIGAGRLWVLRRHVLPNAAEPIGVQLALSLSMAVFVESAMSFLGIGVRPPAPSLGSLISDGINYADNNLAFVLGPLAMVIILVLALQLLAQALGAARRVN
ncbi:ABC transporter permease [Microlunatus elymi]|uniref:ABC transporter permease n=1 Tax=Microlunatus elymi TaxID=2596828 RepID=A0A516Q3T1_9ACTN|nr:ABC transporter permease [Microlunatus elymi]